MTITSKPSTDDYRDGWGRVFGGDVRICPPLHKTIVCAHKNTESIERDAEGNLFRCLDCGARWNPEQRAA